MSKHVIIKYLPGAVRRGRGRIGEDVHEIKRKHARFKAALLTFLFTHHLSLITFGVNVCTFRQTVDTFNIAYRF